MPEPAPAYPPRHDGKVAMPGPTSDNEVGAPALLTFNFNDDPAFSPIPGSFNDLRENHGTRATLHASTGKTSSSFAPSPASSSTSVVRQQYQSEHAEGSSPHGLRPSRKLFTVSREVSQQNLAALAAKVANDAATSQAQPHYADHMPGRFPASTSVTAALGGMAGQNDSDYFNQHRSHCSSLEALVVSVGNARINGTSSGNVGSSDNPSATSLGAGGHPRHSRRGSISTREGSVPVASREQSAAPSQYNSSYFDELAHHEPSASRQAVVTDDLSKQSSRRGSLSATTAAVAPARGPGAHVWSKVLVSALEHSTSQMALATNHSGDAALHATSGGGGAVEQKVPAPGSAVVSRPHDRTGALLQSQLAQHSHSQSYLLSITPAHGRGATSPAASSMASMLSFHSTAGLQVISSTAVLRSTNDMDVGGSTAALHSMLNIVPGINQHGSAQVSDAFLSIEGRIYTPEPPRASMSAMPVISFGENSNAIPALVFPGGGDHDHHRARTGSHQESSINSSPSLYDDAPDNPFGATLPLLVLGQPGEHVHLALHADSSLQPFVSHRSRNAGASGQLGEPISLFSLSTSYNSVAALAPTPRSESRKGALVLQVPAVPSPLTLGGLGVAPASDRAWSDVSLNLDEPPVSPFTMANVRLVAPAFTQVPYSAHPKPGRSRGKYGMVKSNSCSTMHLRTTVCAPELREITQLVASGVHDMILESHRSRTFRTHRLFSEDVFPLSRGHSLSHPFTPPTFDTVFNFLYSILDSAQLGGEISIITLVYLERMLTSARLNIFSANWPRMTLGALLLASKVWDDQAVWNVDFNTIFPDLKVKETNELEHFFIESMLFDVSVKPAVFASYYFALVDKFSAVDARPITVRDAIRISAYPNTTPTRASRMAACGVSEFRINPPTIGVPRPIEEGLGIELPEAAPRAPSPASLGGWGGDGDNEDEEPVIGQRGRTPTRYDQQDTPPQPPIHVLQARQTGMRRVKSDYTFVDNAPASFM
ncbi:hypothetical protein BC828DRAFT_377381 [Blastocladiella britannica]|nr:hypothetical protein BC828DRAFT_377381 [Blastocladiella britannica]